ncbi:MAG TPA: hypothetical protein VGR62_13685 [Candidatus Binatia bacterium]|jgi:hypothetical protein|nr:hypothetical protein [Candidatus Binatia bacterium]
MKAILSSLLAACVLVTAAGSASAADQTIQGKSITVKDPQPGVDPTARLISASAHEIQSPETIVGNPTLPGSAGGAILQLIANGTNPTSQIFNLPQGNSINGKPFWVAVGATGFRYKDAKGEQGPVKLVTIKRTPGSIFSVKATVSGKNGLVTVLPPNLGTDAYLTLSITGGDRYCVKFGADGKVSNTGPKAFKVTKPELEGCPP